MIVACWKEDSAAQQASLCNCMESILVMLAALSPSLEF